MIKKIIIFFMGLFIVTILINGYILLTTKNRLKLKPSFKADCIIILGASVKSNGIPSDMLTDRLLTGIELYNDGFSKKILMSGDHGSDDYDEVNAMKNYAIKDGISSSDIFMDHAGFSTYDSIYRAKYIFGVKKIIIVSQEYHLYRALYIAKSLGLEAYGVSANKRDYSNQTYRSIREYAALLKDFGKLIYKPEPIYLGDKIDISLDGDITNDK